MLTLPSYSSHLSGPPPHAFTKFPLPTIKEKIWHGLPQSPQHPYWVSTIGPFIHTSTKKPRSLTLTSHSHNRPLQHPQTRKAETFSVEYKFNLIPLSSQGSSIQFNAHNSRKEIPSKLTHQNGRINPCKDFFFLGKKKVSPGHQHIWLTDTGPTNHIPPTKS